MQWAHLIVLSGCLAGIVWLAYELHMARVESNRRGLKGERLLQEQHGIEREIADSTRETADLTGVLEVEARKTSRAVAK